jgi:predicted RNA-binding Zn-ribbon protein involved in translation (DUF1610 family)
MYIGKSKHQLNPNYYGSGLIIRRALEKESKENFKLEVIVYSDDVNKLDELEKQYIKEYRERFGRDNLYNITDGGEGRWAPCSLETKDKIRKALTGKKASIETRMKMSLIRKGRKFSEEHRKNLSGENNGRFIDGRRLGLVKNYCIGCGGECNYRSKRCRSCSSTYNNLKRGKNNG